MTPEWKLITIPLLSRFYHYRNISKEHNFGNLKLCYCLEKYFQINFLIAIIENNLNKTKNIHLLHF